MLEKKKAFPLVALEQLSLCVLSMMKNPSKETFDTKLLY